MLFKKLHKETESIDEKATDDDIGMSEEELEQQFNKQLKKINFRTKVKNAFVYFFIILVALGSFKSLLFSNQVGNATETENNAFICTYLSNYYHFPKTDEENEYLTNFTLDTGTTTNDFASELETANLQNPEVYKVESDKDNANVLHYYVKANYKTKFKDQDETATPINCKVDVAKVNDAYIVVRPISNVSYDIESVTDEETLDSFKYDAYTTNTNLDDDKKADVENTVTLFLKTYNEDIVQAKLLVDEQTSLDALGANTQLELDRLENVSADDDNYYVVAIVKENLNNVLTTSNKYYFVIGKESNKIKTMEVY